MKKHIWAVGVLVIVAIVAGLVMSYGKKSEDIGQVAGEITVGTAVVDSVEVALMESFPLQASATIKGNLPDGCTTIGTIDQNIEGNILKVVVSTERPADAVCTQALVPFEETVILDIFGLPAGDYVVDVNGATASFTLDMDNMVDYESDKGVTQ